MTESGPIRALIACGVADTSIVIAHDSAWLAADVNAISDGTVDLGLWSPEGANAGLWLWEGSGKLVSCPNGDGGYEAPESEYTGTLRGVLPEEIPGLLAMEPYLCLVCDGPATRDYRGRKEFPSCGSPECESKMREAADHQG